MAEVEVTPARPEEQVVFVNLMQLYVHDFSEQWAGMPRGDLQDDGRFAEYPLDAYWRASDHVPLLFRLDNRLIGFALLNAASHGGRAVDRNMAEFFVVRKYRGNGHGIVAARTIFSRYPGSWEAAVARRNLAAIAFWRRAISGHPQVEEVEETDFATAEWNGPIINFRIRS